MRIYAVLRATLCALLLLTLGVAPTLAENDTAATAVQLSAANPSAAGVLPGNGSLRYYRFAYQGGFASVVIHLTWNPGWSVTDAAFGFNVYGPNGRAGEGERGSDVGEASTRVFLLQAASPGEYIVQVYNYANDKTSGYTVETWGLATEPEKVTVGTTPDSPGNSPDNSASVKATAYTAEGQIAGSAAGAFNYFTVEYAGGDTQLSVSLTVTPSNVMEPGAYGFNVYEGETLLVSGDEVERTPTSATKTAVLSRQSPGVLVIQVYNYRDGETASYSLGVNGAAGSVADAIGNTGPESSLQLSSAQVAYRGTVRGNGGFAYYGFNYQGSGERVTLVLGFKPGYGITAGGVGLNLYRGPDLVATSATSEGASTASGVSIVTYDHYEGAYIGVLLFNYTTDIPVEYTLYAIGLR
jgi:hypothetical protein